MSKLFVAVAVGILLGCSMCSAQEVVSPDDGQAKDAPQTTDPIVIDKDWQVASLDVNGESVVINASRSSIALNGNCRELTVNGSDNNVRSCKLQRLTVTGRSNLVTYPSNCKPKVVNKGADNSIVARPPVKK